MANKHPDFWKLKSAFLQAQFARLQADLQLRGVMVACGLDPDKQYHLNDTEETITEVAP